MVVSWQILWMDIHGKGGKFPGQLCQNQIELLWMPLGDIIQMRYNRNKGVYSMEKPEI